MTLAALQIIVCRSASVRRARPDIADVPTLTLAHEFPSVSIRVGDARDDYPHAPTISAEQWVDRRCPFEPFDAIVEPAARTTRATLGVYGPLEAVVATSLEAMTRWQWLVARRNRASQTADFDAVLARLEALHDLEKPLVRADHIHALDTWQWLLRLDPAADAGLQMAALFHDVERLESEADERVEHHAADYAEFKANHARRGASLARDVLEGCGVPSATRERAVSLVAEHESPGAEPGRALLIDADALSFFSRNSDGYVDYFGLAEARRKVAYSLGRMRPAARARLATVRLREDVARLVNEVEASAHAAVYAGEATP